MEAITSSPNRSCLSRMLRHSRLSLWELWKITAAKPDLRPVLPKERLIHLVRTYNGYQFLPVADEDVALEKHPFKPVS